MRTAAETFGISGPQLAQLDTADPATGPRTIATTDYRTPPPAGARSLIDPNGAMFWIAAAAVLGLILVTGQLHVEAALGLRGGK